MIRRMLHLTRRTAIFQTPKLTARWPTLALWAEKVDGDRQAGVSLVWRTKVWQFRRTFGVPWVEWRTVTTPDTPNPPSVSWRERVDSLRAMTARVNAAIGSRLVPPVAVRRFAMKAQGLASGAYQSAVTGKIAPQVKVEYAQWQGWKLVSVYGLAITFAEVVLALPIVAGVAVSFYFAWYAWLVQTNAIQLTERANILMSSANAGHILAVLGVWLYLRWYNKQENDLRTRLTMNLAALAGLGFYVGVSLGRPPL